MISVPVTEASQVAEARRRAVAVAQPSASTRPRPAASRIVVTELATNLVKYGVPGEVLLGTFEDGTGSGVEVIALDKGPGFANIAAGAARRSLHGRQRGHGPWRGAPAIADAFDIVSWPGRGTAVLARVSIDRQDRSGRRAGIGAVAVPMRGETASGDAYAVREPRRRLDRHGADGLGSRARCRQGLRGGVRSCSARHEDKPPGRRSCPPSMPA